MIALALAMLIEAAASMPAGAGSPQTSLPVALPPSSQALVLKEGTEIPMRTDAGLNSRTNRQGDRFDLTVTEDIKVGPYIVIRQGSRAVGEISRLVPKGAFGKSGKLDIELLYVDTGDARIRLSGRAASRGESGTTGVVVTAVLAGAFSAFVTGRSADLPAGTSLVGFVDHDLPLLVQAATRHGSQLTDTH